MTENKEETMLARAREIVSETGLSLIDAMLAAESELLQPTDIPSGFTVAVDVKPRVARWIMMQFPANNKFTLEERLGAYISTVLSRKRVSAMRDLREDPSIVEGAAVTLSREAFRKQTSK